MRLKKKSFRSVLQQRLRQHRIPFGTDHMYRGEYNLLTKLQGHDVSNTAIRGNNAARGSVENGMAAIEALRAGFWDVVNDRLSSLMVVIPGARGHKKAGLFNVFVFTGPATNGRVLGQYIVVAPQRPDVEVDRAEVDQPFDFVEMRFGARVSEASRVVGLDTKKRAKVLYSRSTKWTAYSRSTLVQMAEALGIRGRSRMTKPQLELAVANRRGKVSFTFPKATRYVETSNSFFTSNGNSDTSSVNSSAKAARRIAEMKAYHKEKKLPFYPTNVNLARKSAQHVLTNYHDDEKARRKEITDVRYPPDEIAAALKQMKNNGLLESNTSSGGSGSSRSRSRSPSRSTASGPSGSRMRSVSPRSTRSPAARSPVLLPSKPQRRIVPTPVQARAAFPARTRSPAPPAKPRRRIVPTPVFVPTAFPARAASPARVASPARAASPARRSNLRAATEVINLTGLNRSSPRRRSPTPRRRSPSVINLT